MSRCRRRIGARRKRGQCAVPGSTKARRCGGMAGLVPQVATVGAHAAADLTLCVRPACCYLQVHTSCHAKPVCDDDDGGGSKSDVGDGKDNDGRSRSGSAHGRERREPGHRRRWRERCAHKEAVLEAMRSGGDVVALGRRRRDDGGGEERRRYIGGTFSPE